MLLNKKVWAYILILIIILVFLYVLRNWIEPYIDKSSSGTFANIINESLGDTKK